jgi:hypothetical protein
MKEWKIKKIIYYKFLKINTQINYYNPFKILIKKLGINFTKKTI